MKKDFYPTTITQSVLITVLFLLTISIVLGIFTLIDFVLIDSALTNVYILTFAKIFSYPLGLFVVYKFVVKKSNFKRFDFTLPNFKILVLVSLISLLSILVIYFPFDYLFITSFKINFSGNSFTLDKVIGELILSPITEELVFRAIILKGLLTKMKPWKAILISALLFGVPHFNPINQGAILGAIVLGLLTGWIYYKTYKIIYTIVMHFIVNLTILTTIYYFNNFNSEVFTNESYFLYGENSLIFLSLFLILFISAIFIANRLIDNDSKKIKK